MTATTIPVTPALAAEIARVLTEERQVSDDALTHAIVFMETGVTDTLQLVTETGTVVAEFRRRALRKHGPWMRMF